MRCATLIERSDDCGPFEDRPPSHIEKMLTLPQHTPRHHRADHDPSALIALPVPRWKDKACKQAHPQDAESPVPDSVPALCVTPDQPCFRCELPQIKTPHTSATSVTCKVISLWTECQTRQKPEIPRSDRAGRDHTLPRTAGAVS